MSEGFDHPSAAGRALVERVRVLVEGARVRVLHARAVRKVLEALARFADGAGRCFCSHDVLAREAAYSARHVARALDQAEASGLLLRAVPRYAARLAGTATEFSLPWWALTPARGLEGAREVLGLRRDGPVARGLTRGVAAALVELLEDLHPAELVRRVAGRVGGAFAAEIVRAYASGLVPVQGRGEGAEGLAPPSLHVTPGRDKTSSKRTLHQSSPASRRGEKDDRGSSTRAEGSAGTAERLRRVMERASAVVAAREGAAKGAPLSESS